MELRLTTFLKQIFWNISYSFDFPWNQSVKTREPECRGPPAKSDAAMLALNLLWGCIYRPGILFSSNELSLSNLQLEGKWSPLPHLLHSKAILFQHRPTSDKQIWMFRGGSYSVVGKASEFLCHEVGKLSFVFRKCAIPDFSAHENRTYSCDWGQLL